MLDVDSDEHLHDMVFGQAIEDDDGNKEVLIPNVCDVHMQREKPMLTVDGAQDTFTFRNLEPSQHHPRFGRLEHQLLVAQDDDGTGNRKQITRLPTLLIILHKFVYLSPNDLTLVNLLIQRNTSLKQI